MNSENVEQIFIYMQSRVMENKSSITKNSLSRPEKSYKGSILQKGTLKM